MGMTEYEDEPVKACPNTCPRETMVWQGRPTTAAMARRVFYIPHLALYFGLLIAGHGLSLDGRVCLRAGHGVPSSGRQAWPRWC